eukprot:scaffold1900_cov389-Prasinococcus_capsulatus_cf.AAC.9
MTSRRSRRIVEHILVRRSARPATKPTAGDHHARACPIRRSFKGMLFPEDLFQSHEVTLGSRTQR